MHKSIYFFLITLIVTGAAIYFLSQDDVVNVALVEKYPTKAEQTNNASSDEVEPLNKLVSIPKPLVLARSDSLEPKLALKESSNQNIDLFEAPKNDYDAMNETRISNSVIDKITQSTGVPREEIERAMNQESE